MKTEQEILDQAAERQEMRNIVGESAEEFIQESDADSICGMIAHMKEASESIINRPKMNYDDILLKPLNLDSFRVLFGEGKN